MTSSWQTGEQLWGWKFFHGYPLMIFLGVIVSTLTVAYFWKRYKYSWEILQILIIIVIPMAIFGSKFYTLVFDGGWENWYKLQGLSIYGALIFAFSSGMIYIWFVRHAVDFRTVFSIVVPTILIGQAIGRWGNYFNHEVYGNEVSGESLNWMTFLKSNMYIDGAYRAPIFFYESMLSLLGYLILVWFLNNKSIFKPGASAGLYMVWYGIERFILQLFRDPRQTSYIGSSDVSLNLVISVIFVVIGFILFFWYQIMTKPFNKHVIRIFSPKILKNFSKEYKIVKFIQSRKLFFVRKKINTTIKLYVPNNSDKKWSKKEINKGKRNF